ncbi:thioredoxin reductase (NADPH) [Duganella sp. CF402]|uniref:FAD-dependent oxidoreductase n=1 Tax=unclassified Duganella TaxID=2636909 RepID=UPI0008D52E8D|nr:MULTISPECIES: cyclic nucleotide-binding domain-containing thioredoxin-disulfide reductase [unclassified Duganella]RZT04503.1 thioredoxin reductase (NADPH) [Duganella sp. BK701]SEM34133.1 thioredoxin reductase (NADPH) [Duganella sp. CF402]
MATSPSDLLPELTPDEPSLATAHNLEQRHHQMFPTLNAADIRHMQRFGHVACFRDGEMIFEAGKTSFGLMLVLKGGIRVERYDGLGNSSYVTTHQVGQFSGEVAQLSGRPSLGNGYAVDEVEVLVVPSESLRALLVAHAELGERIVRALILRRVGLIEQGSGGPVIVGPRGHGRIHTLQTFLAANGHPHTVLDPEHDKQAADLMAHYQPRAEELPLVVCPDGVVKKNPSVVEIGRCLGMLPELDGDKVWDVIVVGAGPAGLATAVYAASEGLSVLALETRAYGGQAGASARIENYLGFPTGVSGRALAGRAYVQAQKFGVEIAIPAPAGRLICDTYPLQVEMCGSLQHLKARTVVLSCGARYRRPSLANLKQFEGKGVYYWASPVEAKLCKTEEIVLVGGGNSAGQAAVFLSGYASKVHMLIRKESLSSTMSSYLIERIQATPNIELHTCTEIIALEGDEDGLKQVRIRNAKTEEECDYDVCRVFLFIGADPNTGWLSDCGVDVDPHGFIRTGFDVTKAQCRANFANGVYPKDLPSRAALETSVPGVFAIGDVRATSTKRVAAAVGEGAAVVSQIHQFLANLPLDKVRN